MRSLPRVLIVEDEPAIAELLSVNLRHNGFQAVWAIDADSAQRELDAVQLDRWIIVLGESQSRMRRAEAAAMAARRKR